MNCSFKPSKLLVLLAMSCLAWVGLISSAVGLLFGTSVSTGWIIAAALVFGIVVWVVVMLREVRQAIELPDFSASGKRFDSGEEGEQSTVARPRSGKTDVLADRIFMARWRLASGKRFATQASKVRFRRKPMPKR